MLKAILQWSRIEFARRKFLAAIGDMNFMGAPIITRYEGRGSKRRLNNTRQRAIFADQENWEVI